MIFVKIFMFPIIRSFSPGMQQYIMQSQQRNNSVKLSWVMQCTTTLFTINSTEIGTYYIKHQNYIT
jgi:hypothetical protein